VSQLTSPATRTITYPWIILSAITIPSWWPVPGHARGAAASAPITVAVILLGFIKGRMIIRYFMKVRIAPRWLKLFHRRVAHRCLWAGILAIYSY
jgi:Prokaryotic Cytochrome C oxidase subunit IV